MFDLNKSPGIHEPDTNGYRRVSYPLIDLCASEKEKKQVLYQLRESFSDETVRKLEAFVKIDGQHSGHVLGELGGYSQTVDTRVLKEIHSLVESGVRSTSEIRGHINRFVPTLMDEPPTKSRRFVPKDQDIRNAVYRSLQKSRHCEDDQVNVKALVDSWQLAANYMKGLPLDFTWTAQEIQQKRKNIGRLLLSEADLSQLETIPDSDNFFPVSDIIPESGNTIQESDNDFPVPDNIVPVSVIIPESGNTIQESDNDFPVTDNDFPVTDNDFPVTDNDFPVPDNDFPVSDIIPELDNAIPESDNTIPESDNAIPQSEESEIIIPESSTKKHIQPVTKKHRIYKGSPQKYSLRNITCNKEKTFVYPKLKLKSEEYCVCNQPDDGSLYIQCEICEKWFHPSCVGAEEDIGDASFCCPCCSLPSPIDLEDKDLNNSNKITDYSGSLADAEFNKLLMFLMTIMKCSDDYCEEVDHVAHHTFIKKPIQFHRTEMKKAGYGADKFGVQFIEALHDKIQRTIAVTKRKNPRKPYTGGVFLTLRSLPESCDLARVLHKHELFSSHYITDVIGKEALKYLWIQRTGCCYEHAEAILKLSEVDFSEIMCN
ncbi:hypothetical protein ScPMuIL_004740 [Solemya velum]